MDKRNGNLIISKIAKAAFALVFLSFVSITAFASGGHEKPEPGHEHCLGKTTVTDEIIHHVAESHDWHIFDFPVGTCDKGHVKAIPIGIHLPYIIIDTEEGLKFFGDHHALEEAGYLASDVGTVAYEADHHRMVLDVSFTKSALHLLFIGVLMMFLFTAVAKGYKKNEGKAPTGIQSFVEPLVVFVRDDIGKTYLGDKAGKFMPYMLTLFFFIWLANLLGLTPLNSNIAGNTSFTLAMAIIAFFYILANTTKDFWAHIFWFPGVPVPVKFLMIVVELMGLLTKPIALAIRLFANISAGHFMVLALIGLIFIFGDYGESIVGGLGVAPISIAFSLFIFGLEMIVAAVQAYVFVLLTAVFISQAMETHDDHH